MILKNHITIDKLMLDSAKDKSAIIEHITKNMERNLIEALLEKIKYGRDYKINLHEAVYYEDPLPYMCGYKMALELEELGWIPCSERMPSIGQFVLLSGEIEGATKIIIAGGDQVRYWGSKFPGLAWMPLPEPYKEK